MNVVAYLVIAIGLAAVVALGARVLARRRRLAGEPARLQAEITMPLGRDPALAGLPIRPLAWFDWWGDLTVELFGEAPSPWYRYAARRTVERELRRRRLDAMVIDRLRLVPSQIVRRRA